MNSPLRIVKMKSRTHTSLCGEFILVAQNDVRYEMVSFYSLIAENRDMHVLCRTCGEMFLLSCSFVYLVS
jgi:hypothetical protein